MPVVEDDLIVAQSIKDCHQDAWSAGNDGEQQNSDFAAAVLDFDLRDGDNSIICRA